MELTELQKKLLGAYVYKDPIQVGITEADYDALLNIGFLEETDSTWHEEHPRAGQPLPTRFQASETGEKWLRQVDPRH